MSSVEPVRRLPNFVDATAEELDRRGAAADFLARLLALRGYERIETPLIEQVELFVRKSGGELSSRLYGFVEPGGYRVGLRPEFTAPVLRHAIDTVGDGGWPRRYQYSGPVFRYASPEDDDGGKTRQFTQVGAETIGTDSPMADGEIIAAALEGLRGLGVPSPVAVVGHVGILWELLKPFGLSERARLFLVNSVGQLRNGGRASDAVRSEADRLGLTGAGESEQPGSNVPRGTSLADVAAVIDATIGPTDANAGVRSRAEIVERLAKKQMMTSDPESFSRAFELIAKLAGVHGAPGAALKKAGKIISQAGGDSGAIEPLRRVIDAALSEGVAVDSLAVDLGLARGIAYYTGMVFDLHSRETDGDSLGGGGRYDGLTRALGAANDLPALGFAYNLEAVMHTGASQSGGSVFASRVVVVPSDESAVGAAVKEAARLRVEGAIAILDFEARTPTEREAYARRAGASETISVAQDGTSRREPVR